VSSSNSSTMAVLRDIGRKRLGRSRKRDCLLSWNQSDPTHFPRHADADPNVCLEAQMIWTDLCGYRLWATLVLAAQLASGANGTENLICEPYPLCERCPDEAVRCFSCSEYPWPKFILL